MKKNNSPKKNVRTAVILAAGRGTRLQPYTHDIPKGLMQVGDETLIARSVRLLQQNGIKHIFIGTGHLHEQYDSLAKSLEFTTFHNPEYATTGSFATLLCGESLLTEDFLLLESDLLYHNDALAEILTSEEADIMLCSGFTHSNDEVYIEMTDEGLLKNLSKKKDELKKLDGELVGICKISINLWQALRNHVEHHATTSNKDYERALADIANEKHIAILKLENLVWCEIDNEAHLERAKEVILPKINHKK